MSTVECIVKRPFFHRGTKRRMDPGDRLTLSPQEAKALGPRFVSITNKGLKGPKGHKMIEDSSNK